jgi:hypothetical protein
MEGGGKWGGVGAKTRPVKSRRHRSGLAQPDAGLPTTPAHPAASQRRSAGSLLWSPCASCVVRAAPSCFDLRGRFMLWLWRGLSSRHRNRPQKQTTRLQTFSHTRAHSRGGVD